MATNTEDVIILKVGTDEAVKSVNDLRQNVAQLKKNLGDLEIGTDEYQSTLKELTVNQTALKNAMYATDASMEDLSAGAKGLSTTYNGLVAQMAQLKTQLRNVDVSTESGQAQFKKYAEQINEINDQLKEMDAMQGNYQRNVGNYTSALDGLGDTLKALPPTLGSVKEQAGRVGDTIKLVGQQPLLGVIGLLAPMIMQIVDALKDNETALNAVKKLMSALQPIFDVMQKAIEAIATGLSKAVDWLVNLAGESSGTFSKIIAGAVGVGNAFLQYLLTPIRSVVEAVKGMGNVFKDVFSGDFKKIKEDALTTIDGIKSAFSKGFDFSGNFQKGKEVGAQFLAGLGDSSNKAEAEVKGEELGTAVGDGFAEALDKALNSIGDSIDSAIDEAIKAEEDASARIQATTEQMLQNQLTAIEKNKQSQLSWNDLLTESEEERAQREYNIIAEANQMKLDTLHEFYQSAQESGDLEEMLEYEQQISDLSIEIAQNELAEKKRINAEELADKEAKSKQIEALATTSASAVSGLLGSLADMYESDSKNAKKNAKKIKAMRIASTTIDMLMGVVSAMTNATRDLGFPVGPIVGAVQAAAITASGIANIAKIKNTQIGDSESSSTATPTVSTASATATAPAVSAEIQQVRQVVSDTEAETASQSQRVYIVASDIEASQNSIKTKVAETSF